MLKTLTVCGAIALVAAFAGSAVGPRAHANGAQLQPPAVEAASPGTVAIDASAATGSCEVAGYEAAAARNAASMAGLAWAPFGPAEHGWGIYQAHVAQDIGTSCDPSSTGFAAAMAHWQHAHGQPGDGEATLQTLTTMKTAWQTSRPYMALRASGVCPNPPAAADLTTLSSNEGYLGKSVQLRTDVAQAYRSMVEAARHEVPQIAADPQVLKVFSGYRSPAYDAARCARDHNCGGAARATCSVHRTGEAFDLVVGAAPGFAVDSSDNANRLYQSRTVAYRWLVANAGRFGFINYSFEPWHWEWRGSPTPDAPVQQVSLN